MRKLLLILVAVLVVAAAAVLLLRGTRREWTTESPEALAAFGRGLEDLMRYYREDAHREFERAVELDPEFVSAKVQLLDTTDDGAERKRIFEELKAADLSRLTARERFLVEYILARRDDTARSAILSRYLASHSRDPWALFLAAGAAWARQDWDSAEELYLRLLATDPNWVMAHNHLGYIAMAQGRFEEAEERFRAYAFVAPDQANPHDSLGELLILRGRYDEARGELEAALAVRPDFCASYGNLARLAMLEDRPQAVDELAARVETHCGESMAAGIRCDRDRWVALRRGDYDSYWQGFEASSCQGRQEHGDVLAFRLVHFSGREEAADAQLAKLREQIAELPATPRGKGASLAVRLLTLEGIELAHRGELAVAITKLREADAKVPYWNDSNGGLLKLANRLLLADLLDRVGDATAAEALRAEVAAVNPELAKKVAGDLIAVPLRR